MQSISNKDSTRSKQKRRNTDKMASAASQNSHQSPYFLPHFRVFDDLATQEDDVQAYAWMMPTIIEDDDIMFGGKPLSAIYEEDRRQLSEEETRGRSRHRECDRDSSGSPSPTSSTSSQSYASHSQSHHHHHSQRSSRHHHQQRKSHHHKHHQHHGEERRQEQTKKN